ncbi:hypothetical protein E2320_006546, partial [Naja naja]
MQLACLFIVSVLSLAS